MFGTSEDKTTYDVLSEEEVERIQKTDLEVYNTGNPYFGMERIILKDGRSYDTIVRKSIIEDDGKRFLLNTRWDQSLQNELKRRAQLLTVTMEAMNAFTWFFEPAKNRVSFGEGFDNVFFGIGHIMQLHGDGVFVVLQGDDRFVHSRLYVLGRVRHVFEQQ